MIKRLGKTGILQGPNRGVEPAQIVDNLTTREPLPKGRYRETLIRQMENRYRIYYINLRLGEKNERLTGMRAVPKERAINYIIDGQMNVS